MSEACPHCGKPMRETGAPVWETWCETPECVERDRADFWAKAREMAAQYERDEYERLKEKYE